MPAMLLASGCSTASSEVTSGDAGLDSGDAGIEGATQVCQCCGTSVTWPASESCGAGACDGICNVAPRDGGPDAADAACPFAPANNDPRCPATYGGLQAMGTACAPLGLTCAYPGAGDGSGCSAATAMMWCRGDGGVEDASADAGAGQWVVAQ